MTISLDNVSISYIIEQSILVAWNLSLLAMYSIQLRQDSIIEYLTDGISELNSNSAIIIQRIKRVGRTAIILHIGGFIGCIINAIRCVDPFPVLGIYNYSATDLLSHIGIATLLITLFEAISSMILKMFIQLKYKSTRFQRIVRCISYLTLVVAVSTWIVENYVSYTLMYSAGVYFVYGTIIQWILFVLYVYTIRSINTYVVCYTGENRYILNSMLKKLIFIKYLFFIANTVLTAYQIYTFIYQVKDKLLVTTSDKTKYYFPQVPLLIAQLVGYTFILYFSYIKSSIVGDVNGMSEVTNMSNLNIDVEPKLDDNIIKFDTIQMSVTDAADIYKSHTLGEPDDESDGQDNDSTLITPDQLDILLKHIDIQERTGEQSSDRPDNIVIDINKIPKNAPYILHSSVGKIYVDSTHNIMHINNSAQIKSILKNKPSISLNNSDLDDLAVTNTITNINTKLNSIRRHKSLSDNKSPKSAATTSIETSLEYFIKAAKTREFA
jgi:hypothetical protein